MFASIIVVLPSHFTGGDAHLSHAGIKSIFNTSNTSLTGTTVLAWYTDITHEIKPITSGYRFALAYNLIHTTTSLRPAVSTSMNMVAKLRHILLSWKHAKDAPQKIIYMLEHQYSHANLSGSALKGKDAHVAGYLSALCKELNFHLGLANLSHNLSGYADDHGGHCRYRGRHYYEDSEESEDEVDFGEVENIMTTIEHLVDLDGTLIRDDIDFEEEVETIPADLQSSIENGDYDDQEYEGYMGNVSYKPVDVEACQ